MLFVFNKRFRIKAAVAVVLLYAVCILAPSAVFAFADPDAAAHCLTEPLSAAHVHHERVAAKGNVHADDGADIHSDTGTLDQNSDANGKSRGGDCCGLFCVTALAHELGLALSVPPGTRLIQPGLFYELASHGPERINRPPIA